MRGRQKERETGGQTERKREGVGESETAGGDRQTDREKQPAHISVFALQVI